MLHSDLRDAAKAARGQGGRGGGAAGRGGIWGLSPQVAEAIDVVSWQEMKGDMEDSIIEATLNEPGRLPYL